MIALASVAKGVDGSALGLHHPEQARTRLATRTSTALDERFTDVTDRERSPVLDEASDPKNLAAESRVWITSLVEPVPDVDDPGHDSGASTRARRSEARTNDVRGPGGVAFLLDGKMYDRQAALPRCPTTKARGLAFGGAVRT